MKEHGRADQFESCQNRYPTGLLGNSVGPCAALLVVRYEEFGNISRREQALADPKGRSPCLVVLFAYLRYTEAHTHAHSWLVYPLCLGIRDYTLRATLIANRRLFHSLSI